MYDAVTPENVPQGAQMVAGYIGGNYVSYPGLVARCPNAIHISIAVQADQTAQALDCESGDATPQQCPGWATRMRGLGINPIVYVQESSWQAVRNAFDNAHVQQPMYWIANYDGDSTIPQGAIAKQFQGGLTAKDA